MSLFFSILWWYIVWIIVIVLSFCCATLGVIFLLKMTLFRVYKNFRGKCTGKPAN